MKSLILVSTAVAIALAATSCTGLKSTGSGGLDRYNAYDSPAKLPSNPRNVRVKVSLSKQLVYVMEGSQPLLVTPVAVGAPGSSTPQGNFTIFKKTQKHRANTHGYAYSGNQAQKTYIYKKPAGWSFKGTPMPYWCEFKANYGFHTGWMKPYPCTHGCLRMHHNVAPKFFRLVSVGTPVSISTSQAEDATIGANVPRPPDSGPLPDFPASFYIGDQAYSYHKQPSFN